MPNNGDLLIHHLIDSIQRSIDIADKTSRKKYNFALAKMQVKMTLNFEVKQDESTSKSQSKQSKHFLSLFSRKHDPQQISNTEGGAEDSHGSLTIQMLFKPGGKAFAPADDETSPDNDDFDDMDDSDNDSDVDSSDSSDDDF